MFERLTRQYLNSNTKWAAKVGEELSRLRAAEREVMEKKIERLVDEVKAHQRELAWKKRND